jgi:hypothetical protein
MMSRLRGPSGGLSMRARLAALLVVAGLIVLTAPVVVVPIVRALLHAFA